MSQPEANTSARCNVLQVIDFFSITPCKCIKQSGSLEMIKSAPLAMTFVSNSSAMATDMASFLRSSPPPMPQQGISDTSISSSPLTLPSKVRIGLDSALDLQLQPSSTIALAESCADKSLACSTFTRKSESSKKFFWTSLYWLCSEEL